MATEKRLIDANALIDWLTKHNGFRGNREDCTDIDCVDCIIENAIKKAHTVDAVEVAHGRWIGGYYQQGGEWFYKKPVCSECGHEHDGATTYCENCGAKMDEETKFVGICEHCVYRDECDWPKLHPKTKLKECPDFKEGDNK